MSTSAVLRSTTVIRAVHSLHSRFGRGPTAAEIASDVRAEEDDVLVILRHLKKERIFDDRRQQGQRRWSPWEAVN